MGPAPAHLAAGVGAVSLGEIEETSVKQHAEMQIVTKRKKEKKQIFLLN